MGGVGVDPAAKTRESHPTTGGTFGGERCTGTTGNAPTVKVRLRELECRHAAEVDDDGSEIVEEITLTESGSVVRGEPE